MSQPPRAEAPSTLGLSLMAAALALPALHSARADTAPERAVLSYKLLDYLDSQPGKERVHVRAPAFNVLAPVGGDWSVGATLISDAISGASPAHHTSALKNFSDRRNAGTLDVTRYFGLGSVALGANVSNEADYVSRGLSLQGSRSSEDKNSTWTAGIAVNTDSINPTNLAVVDERKRVLDVLVGLTQVLSKQDIVQINLGHSRGRGYFSDPYKVFDKRPRERDHNTLSLRWNHHVEASETTLRMSYRLYDDSFGIQAHTLGFEVAQPLRGGWTITPLLRLYSQNAARFYVDAGPANSPFAPNPPAGAVYFSEDQRVSAFGGRTWGLKIAKQLGPNWLVDFKYEKYGQRASWRLFGGGSPGLASFDARTVQLGASYAF